MIKQDIIIELAEKYDLSYNLASKILNTTLGTLTNGIITDSRAELRRFGVFTVIKQKPRTITLPNGKKIKRPSKKIITFAPSPTIKKKLNKK